VLDFLGCRRGGGAALDKRCGFGDVVREERVKLVLPGQLALDQETATATADSTSITCTIPRTRCPTRIRSVSATW
jgi:hypothetical protein